MPTPRTWFALLGLTLTLSSSIVTAAERPNILVILTDDMGFSDLGCFGGEIDTPNLDALAAGGVRFTEFYNTARCWPTRATLLTGQYCNQLKPTQPTIAEILRSAGYQTAMAGKWHLSRDPKNNSPRQRGFGDYYGTLAGAGSYWDPQLLVRQTELTAPDGDDFYYTDKIAEEAVRQIKGFAKSDIPFFQYVAFTAAHWPLHAPEKTVRKYLKTYDEGWEKMRRDRYARMLKMGVIDKLRWPLPAAEDRVANWETVDHKPWRVRNMAVYAAMVDHMDQAVGEIVKALKDARKFDNTLIVYFHDNGACHEHLSGDAWSTARNVLAKAKDAGLTIAVGDRFDTPMGGPRTYGSVGHNWANAQNTPMRRYKANVHNGGACTPAIMHWPAGLRLKAGSITTQRGHVVDMMATCVELARTKYPFRFQHRTITPHEGLSLAPILAGETVERSRPYIFNHGGTHAVVQGDYKVVREGKRSWALYNLARNRTETQNLASEQPERVRKMAALWEARWGKQPNREDTSAAKLGADPTGAMIRLRIANPALPQDARDQLLVQLVRAGSAKDLRFAAAQASERPLVLKALADVANSKGRKPVGNDLLDLVTPLLGHDNGEIRTQAVRLAGAWKIKVLMNDILDVPVFADAPESAVAAAMISLAQLMGEDAYVNIRSYATPREPKSVQAAVITAVSSFDVRKAAKLAAPLVAASRTEGHTRQLVQPLLAHKDGGKALAAALRDETLSAAPAKRLLAALRFLGSPDSELQEMLRKVVDRAKPK